MKGYVIFREDPNTHEEVYIRSIGDGGVLHAVNDAESGAHFVTARDAYFWAQIYTPRLDNWRVGLR